MSVQKKKSPTTRQPMGHGSTTVQAEDLNEPAIKLPGRWQLAIITVSLCCGTTLVALDTTIISVAVPSISTTFQTFDDVGWYGSAYLLTVTAFQPAFGNIFQLFNAKTTYVVAAVLFEVGSVICAASPTSAAFICGRAITGVGAAGLYQGALSIVGLTVALDQRPMYLGIVLSVFGIAACLGPPLGGILTQHATWRWCFWINLPIGAVSIVLIFCFLKLRVHYSKPPDPILARVRSLDLIGIILTIAWVCCLILALQFGSSATYWHSSRVIGLFVGSGLLLIAFSISQWRQGERSTIPLRILHQRSVLMGAIYSFFLEISIYVTLYYIPFYFQSAQLVSPTVSGVRGIPLGISQIAAVVLTGVVVSLAGHYVPFMVLGQVISIIGTVFLARLEVDTPTALWATFLVIAGVGHGMGLQMPFTAVQVVLSDDDIPIGNGTHHPCHNHLIYFPTSVFQSEYPNKSLPAITVFFSQLGAAIAIAIGESIFHTSIAHQIHASHLPMSAATVIAAGPTGLQSLTTEAAILHKLQGAYAYGIRMVMYFALAATCAAVPFAFGMEWLNLGGDESFAIPALGEYQVLVSSEQHIQELSQSSEDVLSFHAAMEQRINHKYTLRGFEHNDVDPNNDVPKRVLKVLLRMNLPEMQVGLQPLIQDTIIQELTGKYSDGWSRVSAFTLAKHIVARLNNHVILGSALASDSEVVAAVNRYLQDAVVTMELCRHLPSILVPLVAPAMMRWSGAMHRIDRSLTAEIKKRVAESHNAPAETSSRHDCIQWVLQSSKTPAQKTVVRMTQQIFGILFASAHQMSMALVYAMFDLCLHPEYIQPLREEIEHVRHTTSFAGHFDHLPLLDSFLRESARLNALDALTIQRMALSPYTFADGTRVPAGNLVAVPQAAVMQDPRHYPDPTEFDPYRRALGLSILGLEQAGLPRSLVRLENPKANLGSPDNGLRHQVSGHKGTPKLHMDYSNSSSVQYSVDVKAEKGFQGLRAVNMLHNRN
ncbi:hypothetical protein AARAC_008631 [Aspergillus arachidicola]|uniref:Major facilitator superfamily (MFS) profile domain-containing protein n=1 Tax=Aspergillus arachidicola TaxID=656916 RepID=A0A2G7FVU3_9EURO|nr:hypothetical protein AARAC_008631 [Aspergillus arachidicola]